VSDIIERLRGYAKDQGRRHNIEDACEEAANEIERLREALDSITKVPRSEAAYAIIQVFARAALSPAPSKGGGHGSC
jgi:hypothetical protein